MLAAIETHRPALTYIAYPNNPTANLFDEGIVERIVAAVGAQGGLVVFDEAYQPFSSRTWMAKVGSLPHVLVLRTLSKFGLAGVRLGYLAGPAALIDEVDKVRPPYNIGALNAEATLFALEHADEFARQAALLRDERARLQKELAATPGVTPFPSDANMILARVANARGGVPGDEGARRPGQERRGDASAPRRLPAPDGRHAGGKYPHDVGLARQPAMTAILPVPPATTIPPAPRRASIRRDTKETKIGVSVDLDGKGTARIATGIGFFDHMLDQIARHGTIDLEIDAQGDLHIDGHHTVEDVGIALGMAVAEAVGDKRGLTRYGHAYVPLDEALSRVVIDFSGRPSLVMNVPFKSGMIGGFDAQLAHEFFQGFANHALVTLHIDNLRGENAHHQCETVFKAFARALRMAVAVDPRLGGVVPSTKGSL